MSHLLKIENICKSLKSKNSRKVYFNGKFVNEEEAKISIYDSLMFGDMVFEMTRSFDGKQFKLKEHIDRLYTGLKFLEYLSKCQKKRWNKQLI